MLSNSQNMERAIWHINYDRIGHNILKEKKLKILEVKKHEYVENLPYMEEKIRRRWEIEDGGTYYDGVCGLLRRKMAARVSEADSSDCSCS